MSFVCFSSLNSHLVSPFFFFLISDLSLYSTYIQKEDAQSDTAVRQEELALVLGNLAQGAGPQYTCRFSTSGFLPTTVTLIY